MTATFYALHRRKSRSRRKAGSQQQAAGSRQQAAGGKQAAGSQKGPAAGNGQQISLCAANLTVKLKKQVSKRVKLKAVCFVSAACYLLLAACYFLAACCPLAAYSKTMTVKNYTDLIAWQKAMDLVEMIYKLTRQFPKDETYGLTSQIRRAVVSVPSNIAEGQGRWSDADFHRFLGIAHGSLREVETQARIAARLGYATPAQLASLIDLASEVGRLITGLANVLRR